MRKIVFIILGAVLVLGAGIFIFSKKPFEESNETELKVLSPFSWINKQHNNEAEKEEDSEDEILNVMLLGVDRRQRFEAYRTDIMILISMNKKTNQVVLSSLPRDLWYNGQRLNAVFLGSGWDELSSAVFEITGLKPEKYILTDFKDFSWIVDAMGGVTVNVENTFTDYEYPVDETFEYQTINFVQGQEKLTGERALIYARSRKGDNGEGSDWARMKRQHLILRGMVTAIEQPGSLFKPMVVKEAFNTVTQGKMDTNLSIADAEYLWDLYKDKDKYEAHSLFLDMSYLYSPPMEDYGGAWVLAPIEGNYTRFQQDLMNKLNGVEEIPAAEEETTLN